MPEDENGVAWKVERVEKVWFMAAGRRYWYGMGKAVAHGRLPSPAAIIMRKLKSENLIPYLRDKIKGIEFLPQILIF